MTRDRFLPAAPRAARRLNSRDGPLATGAPARALIP